MTPDEAIALVQKYGKDAQVRVDGYSTWQDAACVLAGEVERLRLESLQPVANEVCGKIPEEFMISLVLENGYGGVELWRQNHERFELPFHGDESLAEQINIALTTAIEANQIEGGE